MIEPPEIAAAADVLGDQREANERLVLAAMAAMDSRDEAVSEKAIAERQLLHQAARHLADMAEVQNANRLATLGKLTASIAHELGTPLAVIRARAQMIAAGEVPADALGVEATVILRTQRESVLLRGIPPLWDHLLPLDGDVRSRPRTFGK